MRHLPYLVLPLILFAAAAHGATVNYGWEDGGTILGSAGNLADPLNVAGGVDPNLVPGALVRPHSGERMLQVTESPHAETPQAYLAFVENLTDGDVVTARFHGWDSTDGGPPALRIWAHYAQSGDVNSHEGSGGGNTTFTGGAGPEWYPVGHDWTFDSNDNTRDALVIEARLYSTPATDPGGRTDFWIDSLSITIPDTAKVTVPEPATLALLIPGGWYVLRRRILAAKGGDGR